MNSIKRFFTKNKIVKWICVILAIVACGACFSAVTDNFKKEVNENNLIKYNEYTTAAKTEEFANGLKAKWNEDGTIVLYGKAYDENVSGNYLHEHVFMTLTLQPGTYTFTSGNDNCSEDTYHTFVKVGTQYYRGFKDTKSIVITEECTVAVGFAVKNDYRIAYAKLAPVLVAGAEAQDFFVTK